MIRFLSVVANNEALNKVILMRYFTELSFIFARGVFSLSKHGVKAAFVNTNVMHVT
jgi:hypothetical protein